MKRIAFIIITITAHAFVWGQVEKSEKDSFLRLEPVEVKATRAGQNAPFTTTNLYKKELEKLNLGQDLPFILNQTPSVEINADAGNGVGYTGKIGRASCRERV